MPCESLVGKELIGTLPRNLWQSVPILLDRRVGESGGDLPHIVSSSLPIKWDVKAAVLGPCVRAIAWVKSRGSRVKSQTRVDGLGSKVES